MSFKRSIAISLAAILLGGCVQMSPEYMKASEYEKALFLFERGYIEEARKKALEIDPASQDFKASRKLLSEINLLVKQIARRHMEMGEDYERAGIYQQALAEYKTSLSYNPQSMFVKDKVEGLTEILKTPAEARENGKNLKKAAVKKEEKKEEDPEALANSHYLKGKTYYESRAYNKAIDEFNEALRYVPAYMNARDLLAKAKKEREREMDLHLKKGMGYFQAEEMELAIKEWDAVLELDPNHKKAADYKSRAEVILQRLKNIREKKTGVEQATQ